VHDNGQLVEERLDREILERVLPPVHPQRLAMNVEAGPTLGSLRPFPVPSPWGPPWDDVVSPVWRRARGVVGENGSRLLGSLATAGEAPLYEFTRADLVVVDGGGRGAAPRLRRSRRR
jgi:hypothetical protein